MLKGKKLAFDTLSEMESGRIAAEFNTEIDRISKDCYSRPGDKSHRSVTLTLRMQPVMKSDGTCDRVRIETVVNSKVPNVISPIYEAEMIGGKVIVTSNERRRNDPDQMGIGDVLNPPAVDGAKPATPPPADAGDAQSAA